MILGWILMTPLISLFVRAAFEEEENVKAFGILGLFVISFLIGLGLFIGGRI